MQGLNVRAQAGGVQAQVLIREAQVAATGVQVQDWVVQAVDGWAQVSVGQGMAGFVWLQARLVSKQS